MDKLRKEIDARRKNRKLSPQRNIVRGRDDRPAPVPFSWKHDEEREETLYSFDERRKGIAEQENEPYFRKDRFIMQVLASICLFVTMGILFQTQSSTLEGVREYVKTSFHEDFQFSTVAGWYEGAFGTPLALFPPQSNVVAPGDFENEPSDMLALPATGFIRQSFEQNGRGIYVETTKGETVEAVQSGWVRFVGEDEDQEWGKVIVIRHYDGGESWYGRLENISVQLYDYIDKGDLLGEVAPHQERQDVGAYYFALKEGDTFIDPIDVITFD